MKNMNDDLISRRDAKSKKVYSHERHEYVVPVAELDWLPSAQPDIARDIATIIENEQDMRVILKNERTETHECDYQRTATHDSRREWYMKGYRDAQRWIPFKTRPLTDEEKKEYPYYVDMLDCQLPENGQRILVNIKLNGHESVQMDEYYDDDGSYLDSGYEIVSEATAWMPLPEPWKGEQDGTT